MLMNSFPRWLISITDMPLPCQSSISAAAARSTGSGSTAGPALKLKIRIGKTLLVARIGEKTTLSDANGTFHNFNFEREIRRAPGARMLALSDEPPLDYAPP
jgi:hypothetical protein